MASMDHEIRIRGLEADVAALKKLAASVPVVVHDVAPMPLDVGAEDDYTLVHVGHGQWAVARIVIRCDSKERAREELAALVRPQVQAA